MDSSFAFFRPFSALPRPLLQLLSFPLSQTLTFPHSQSYGNEFSSFSFNSFNGEGLSWVNFTLGNSKSIRNNIISNCCPWYCLLSVLKQYVCKSSNCPRIMKGCASHYLHTIFLGMILSLLHPFPLPGSYHTTRHVDNECFLLSHVAQSKSLRKIQTNLNCFNPRLRKNK